MPFLYSTAYFVIQLEDEENEYESIGVDVFATFSKENGMCFIETTEYDLPDELVINNKLEKVTKEIKKRLIAEVENEIDKHDWDIQSDSDWEV